MDRIYCYGMISPSTVLVLADGFPYPRANTYAEIGGTLPSVGGEAANSAIILAKLGVRAVLDGTWVSRRNEAKIRGLLEPFGIDLSLLHIADEGGTEEYVIADGISRTVFGNYASFHSGKRQWNLPSEDAVKKSSAVALDPYFKTESALAAELCVRHRVPYVTLDSRHEDYVARNAAAVIISHELTDQAYPGADMKEVYRRYLDACSGLVIFTFGEKELWYGRKGGETRTYTPYQIEPVDTTGAGDSFRGAVAYGLSKGWDDGRIVDFASAVAAQVCLTLPHALNAPGLDAIESFIRERR